MSLSTYTDSLTWRRMPDFDHLPEALRNIIAAYGPPAVGYVLWWRVAWWTKSVLYRVSVSPPGAFPLRQLLRVCDGKTENFSES